MPGTDLTPSRPPRKFSLTTDAELQAAYAVLIAPIDEDGYALLGTVTARIDNGGPRYLTIEVNRNGQSPAALARVGEGKSIVVDVSGVFALTDEEIAERYL